MIEIFKTIDERLVTLNSFEEGAWINLVNPTEQEVHYVSESLNLDSDYIKVALDEEESSRIETDEACTLAVVDIPIAEANGVSSKYITIPLGIIINEKYIITVCLKENQVTREFIEKKTKGFFTFKKTRFFLQILYKNATKYLLYLKQIDKLSHIIENKLHRSTKNKELIQLLELEKSLVYFSTSLKANEVVLERMLRTESIKSYPDDAELLEDTIIENKQAIEMARIYSDILSGTMDAFASVISNNLNIVMKFLASVTIVMAIPNMIASYFGMNVQVPMANNPFAFPAIVMISAVLCAAAAMFMARKKMF
ncbi:MAG: magnesium transporter CorA family protein [Clostridiaceae bacterium]|jgi:magnesium transporter|nr:magnesium transporter CorA family protein [Clostridiaceae bacterium]